MKVYLFKYPYEYVGGNVAITVGLYPADGQINHYELIEVHSGTLNTQKSDFTK